MAAAPPSRVRDARIAGLWYLAMVLSGPFGIIYVPSRLIVAGDAAATAANIAAHPLLLRLGTASSLVCQVAFVFTVLALRRLFSGIGDGWSRMMGALVVAGVPVAVSNELFQLAALELGSGGAYAGLPAEHRAALALLALQVHAQGIFVASFFWGLWLLPFGVLVIRSGFIPKVIGALLVAGCCSYLLDSTFALLLPQYHDTLSSVLMLPLAAGELSAVAWLLIKGARAAPTAAADP